MGSGGGEPARDGHRPLAIKRPAALDHQLFRLVADEDVDALSSQLCLERPDELDAEFESWIREAYAVGRQEHLEKKMDA